LASGKKTMKPDEAFKSIEGLKYKIANKYKNFCDNTVTYEDLISAANVGVAWAYRDWDADTAKFITFAHNRIERQIDLYLTEMLPRYKNNIDAKNWLRRKNDESLKTLMERNVTKDVEFNKKHELDGVKEFTKELYNLYTQKVANDLFNNGQTLVINPSSAFQSKDNDNFDIIETAGKHIHENMSPLKKMEIDFEIAALGERKKKIATLIMEGYTVGEVAKELGITKAKLVKEFDIQG